MTGRVLNARTRSPVFRALVTLESRAVLTDALGRFSFPDFNGSHATLMATKPGYSQGSDPLDGSSQRYIQDLSQPIELKLYANAVVMGTLKSRDGTPLCGVPVTLLHTVYDVSGIHAVQTGFSITNSHGEYRFVQPAGQYRVQSQFIPLQQETGKQLLPTSFPQDSASDHASFFELRDGKELHIDLLPLSATPIPILLQLEPKNNSGNLHATATTQAGDSFPINLQATATSGEYRTELVPGTYAVQLHAAQGEQSLNGSAQILITSTPSAPLQIQLSPLSSLPVEVRVDEAQRTKTNSTASNQALTDQRSPTPASLNLLLQNLSHEHNVDAGQMDLIRHDHDYFFRLAPGRYHLRTPDVGTWHVLSATSGTSDLMENDIVVGTGTGGEPLRIAVGDRSGQVSGTVDVTHSEGSAWVYILPRAASLTPFYEIRTSPQGVWRRSLPPGSYTVIAVPRRPLMDLTDAAERNRFAANGTQIEIVDAVNITTDLQLSRPAGELP